MAIKSIISVCSKVQCTKCKSIIESTHVHDYVTCHCGACMLDGGNDYVRSYADQPHKDLSKVYDLLEVDIDGEVGKDFSNLYYISYAYLKGFLALKNLAVEKLPLDLQTNLNNNTGGAYTVYYDTKNSINLISKTLYLFEKLENTPDSDKEIIKERFVEEKLRVLNYFKRIYEILYDEFTFMEPQDGKN